MDEVEQHARALRPYLQTLLKEPPHEVSERIGVSVDPVQAYLGLFLITVVSLLFINIVFFVGLPMINQSSEFDGILLSATIAEKCLAAVILTVFQFPAASTLLGCAFLKERFVYISWFFAIARPQNDAEVVRVIQRSEMDGWLCVTLAALVVIGGGIFAITEERIGSTGIQFTGFDAAALRPYSEVSQIEVRRTPSSTAWSAFITFKNGEKRPLRWGSLKERAAAVQYIAAHTGQSINCTSERGHTCVLPWKGETTL